MAPTPYEARRAQPHALQYSTVTLGGGARTKTSCPQSNCLQTLRQRRLRHCLCTRNPRVLQQLLGPRPITRVDLEAQPQHVEQPRRQAVGQRRAALSASDVVDQRRCRADASRRPRCATGGEVDEGAPERPHVGGSLVNAGADNELRTHEGWCADDLERAAAAVVSESHARTAAAPEF